MNEKLITAVSNTPSTQQATITGSGTVVQGDGNIVIGAGAAYVNNSVLNLSESEVGSEDVLETGPEIQQLRKQMAEYFNLNDLQNVCWDLGIS